MVQDETIQKVVDDEEECVTQAVSEIVPTVSCTKKVIKQPDLEIREVIDVNDANDSFNSNKVVQS